MEIALQQIAKMGPDKKLDISQLGLTELPPLPPDLRGLKCYKNKLTRLPKLPKTLKELRCDQNLLEELPELPRKLEFLTCGDNKLTKLPPLPKNLLDLNCKHNLLETLPELPETLYELDCTGNRLSRLPELPDNMRILMCSLNQLTKLPKLPYELYTLDCTENKLTTLPHLPIDLHELEAYGNPFVEPFRSLIREYSLNPSLEALDRLSIFVNKANELAEQGRNLQSLMLAIPSQLQMPYGPQANVGSFLSGVEGVNRTRKTASLSQQMRKLKRSYETLGRVENANVLPLPYGPSELNFKGGDLRTRRKTSKRKTQKRRR